MRVLVNALSLGSLSGQHVLFGHISQLAKWTATKHEFVVLHQAGQGESVRTALPFQNVSQFEAPVAANHWATRSAWETFSLPKLIREHSIALYFTPSGTVLQRSPVPQVSLAQNPWCMVPKLHRTRQERLKATIQRAAYRQAVRSADLMVYNSRHIQSLYAKTAQGIVPGDNRIVFQGINDETHEIAAEMRTIVERKPLSILSVSAMAHWKGAETVVRAVAELRKRSVEATLNLVGPWPDPAYERLVRSEVSKLGLSRAVNITGKVSVNELHDYYASSQVYCLMSECESFGIPAVEAQAFGTPVVGSSTCAMAEIGGDGGVFCPPGDAIRTANLLEPLLTDHDHWQVISENAVINSQTYQWEHCSRPLLAMFDIASTSITTTPDANPSLTTN